MDEVVILDDGQELRAFKVLDAEERIIEGYAATWDEDDEGETFDQRAFSSSLDRYLKRPVLLWRHGRDKEVGTNPIGRVLEAKLDGAGLWVRAQLYKGNRYADYAWGLIKQGIRNFSVGGMAEKVRKIGRRILEWPLVEISVEDFAANPHARFEIVKAMLPELAKGLGVDVAELCDEWEPEDGTAGREAEPKTEGASTAEPVVGEGQEGGGAPPIDHEESEEPTMSEKNETPTLDVAGLLKQVEQTVVKAMDARDESARAQAEAKRQDEERIEAEVQKRLEAATKELEAKGAVIRKVQFPTGEKDTPAVKGVWGPFDREDPTDLALGYMVMKSAGAQPSREYIRSMHGLAAKRMEAGLLDHKAIYPEAGLGQGATKHLAAPVIYASGRDKRGNKAGDMIIAEHLATKADELMGSDVSAYGDEWVPVFYSRELIPLIRNQAKVLSLFRQVEVTGESWIAPIQTGTATWYKTAQADDAADLSWADSYVTARVAKVGTSKLTLTPAKLSAIVAWTGELDEQSLVPMLPFLRQEMVTSGQEVMDEILISGDETATNQCISDYGNSGISTLWRLLLLDGLRHHPLVDATANKRDGGALTAEDFLATKRLMGTNGAFALDPSKLAWIVDPSLYWKLQALGEALTLDKMGPGFTFQSGVIERVFGSPVIVSDQYGSTDSSGYIHTTVGNNTLGSFMCVRPDQGIVGFGRRLRIETERRPASDAYFIVAHIMLDFDLATNEACALSYNVTVA